MLQIEGIEVVKQGPHASSWYRFRMTRPMSKIGYKVSTFPSARAGPRCWLFIAISSLPLGDSSRVGVGAVPALFFLAFRPAMD